MYPGFAKTAREEGFEEIAEWFETLARAEKSHAGRFQKGLDRSASSRRMRKLTRADIRGPRAVRGHPRRLAQAGHRAQAGAARVGGSAGDAGLREPRHDDLPGRGDVPRRKRSPSRRRSRTRSTSTTRCCPTTGSSPPPCSSRSPTRRRSPRTLERLVGLQDHVWLVVGGERIAGEFDPEQFKRDKLAAVQYLRFALVTDGAARR